jgi:hypothetical protein
MAAILAANSLVAVILAAAGSTADAGLIKAILVPVGHIVGWWFNSGHPGGS